LSFLPFLVTQSAASLVLLRFLSSPGSFDLDPDCQS
jgi:hypothetical protein